MLIQMSEHVFDEIGIFVDLNEKRSDWRNLKPLISFFSNLKVTINLILFSPSETRN